MRALEVTGTVDHSGQLHLDQPLTAGNDQRVRVIVLILETDNTDNEEIQQPRETDEEEILLTFSPDPLAHFIGATCNGNLASAIDDTLYG